MDWVSYPGSLNTTQPMGREGLSGFIVDQAVIDAGFDLRR
jgi:hypothetical protein